MSPNKPSTELKISITRIFTNLDKIVNTSDLYLSRLEPSYKDGSAASARAAPLPLMPTEIPHIRLHIPTVSPDQNNAKPV